MNMQDIKAKFDAVMCEMRAAGLDAKAVNDVMESSLTDHELYALATTDRAHRMLYEARESAFWEQKLEVRRQYAERAEQRKTAIASGKRWEAVARYQTDNGLIENVYHVEEIQELQSLLNLGSDGNALADCRITLNRRQQPGTELARPHDEDFPF
jgi:hypothetical protein